MSLEQRGQEDEKLELFFDDHCSSNFVSYHCKFCWFLSARSDLCYSLYSGNIEKIEWVLISCWF